MALVIDSAKHGGALGGIKKKMQAFVKNRYFATL